MGANTFVNIGGFIDGSAPVTLEDHVRVGPYVRILTGTHQYRHSVIRRDPRDGTVGRPVLVKRGCWIGMGCSILPGVTVAEGCVIAAGAVIVDDTEPNGLYGGVPAKRIRDLPTD